LSFVSVFTFNIFWQNGAIHYVDFLAIQQGTIETAHNVVCVLHTVAKLSNSLLTNHQSQWFYITMHGDF